MNIVARLWGLPEFGTLDAQSMALAAYICSRSVDGGRVPGLLAEGAMSIAEGIRSLTLEQVNNALRELQRIGLIEVDAHARLIRVPMAPSEAPPRNSRHLTSWLHRWRELPASPLKYRHLSSLYDTVKRLARDGGKKGDGWLEAWNASFGALDPATYPQETSPQGNLFDSAHLIGQRVNAELTRYQIDPDPDPDPSPVSESGSALVPDPDPEAPETPEASPPRARSLAPRTKTRAQIRDEAWKQVSGEFQERYAEITGGAKPTWNGTTRKLLEPFVRLHGPDEVCRRIGILFTAPPAWILRDGECPDVKTLVAHFDKLATPSRATGPPRRAQTGDEIRAMVAEMRDKGVP